jgi:hypothetical protein
MSNRQAHQVNDVSFQEYLAGRTELEGYKRGLDSFVCAVMPNSGNTQIRTTPGMSQVV